MPQTNKSEIRELLEHAHTLDGAVMGQLCMNLERGGLRKGVLRRWASGLHEAATMLEDAAVLAGDASINTGTHSSVYGQRLNWRE